LLRHRQIPFFQRSAKINNSSKNAQKGKRKKEKEKRQKGHRIFALMALNCFIFSFFIQNNPFLPPLFRKN
jgi:hypothetical protein